MILPLLISCAQDHYIPYPYEKYDTGIIEEETTDNNIEDSGENVQNDTEETGETPDDLEQDTQEEEPEVTDPNDVDDDGDGQTENEGDCDDSDPSIYSGGEEVEDDGIDQDCDGQDLESIDPNDVDDDGDGFTENDGDCDDSDVATNPDALDDTEDFFDNDCDGLVDEDYIPPVVDLYEYGGDFAVAGNNHWPGIYYAADYGYSEIDAAGTGRSNLVCGLLNGFVDCFCDHNGSNQYSQCGTYTVDDYIPFQQFESLSISESDICTLDSSGNGLCWDGNGNLFNIPSTSDPYIKVLSLGGDYVCALTEGGSLYCFNDTTGGLVYSDANTYKDIDGRQSSVTGVSSDGLFIVYIEILSGYTSTSNPGYEVLGMGAGNHAYCYGGIDQNGMQTVECYERYPVSQNNNGNATHESCLPSAPHHYYYQFLSQGTDLMNIEVSDSKWAGIYDPVANTTALWGGYYTHTPWATNGAYNYAPIVSSGEWTGSQCNYAWGN